MNPSIQHVIIEGHNSSFHDGGVAVFRDGDIIALSAERVDREKHSFNSAAAYEFLRSRLQFEGSRVQDFFCAEYQPFQEINHPLVHASSAFLPSGFDEAVILVAEGQGGYKHGKHVSLSVWRGDSSGLQILEANPQVGPLCVDSWGHAYSAVTYYLGFGQHDQWKTMALASYGDPSVYKGVLGDLFGDPSFVPTEFHVAFGKQWGNADPPGYLGHSERFTSLLGPRRGHAEPINRRHIAIAAAAQRLIEDLLVEKCIAIRQKYGITNLCLAGGVAHNVHANYRIVRESGFEHVFIQPAAGDDGQALGKLLYRLHNQGIARWRMKSAFLGPPYDEEDIRAAIADFEAALCVEQVKSNDCLLDSIAAALMDGRIVAWFQGRSELGPRALGHRSILADPRRPDMRDILNRKVKHREEFQPFAASVIAEFANELWDLPVESPYMLLAAKDRGNAETTVPAVVHVDRSTRIQTVRADNDPLYYALLRRFGKAAGVPVLLNTSFNDRGEPIVETPRQAIESFLRMKLDLLVLHNFVLRKKA